MRGPILFATAVSAATILLGAWPSVAATYPKGGVTAEDVATDLRGIGLKVTLGKDLTGDPKLDVMIPLKDAEAPYIVLFFDCEKQRCKSITYHAAFPGKPDQIAKWNQEARFARAYLDSNRVNIDYDVDLEVGANSEAVANTAERFEGVLIEAIKFMGDY